MMAVHHHCPRQPSFRVRMKLLTQIPFDIALGLIESCNAYECEIVQDYLKAGDQSGDYEALYAHFK
eukprot:3410939-Pyramimonas_sp.AAC.1